MGTKIHRGMSRYNLYKAFKKDPDFFESIVRAEKINLEFLFQSISYEGYPVNVIDDFVQCSKLLETSLHKIRHEKYKLLLLAAYAEKTYWEEFYASIEHFKHFCRERYDTFMFHHEESHYFDGNFCSYDAEISIHCAESSLFEFLAKIRELPRLCLLKICADFQNEFNK